jgi:hypothetical protein
LLQIVKLERAENSKIVAEISIRTESLLKNGNSWKFSMSQIVQLEHDITFASIYNWSNMISWYTLQNSYVRIVQKCCVCQLSEFFVEISQWRVYQYSWQLESIKFTLLNKCMKHIRASGAILTLIDRTSRHQISRNVFFYEILKLSK